MDVSAFPAINAGLNTTSVLLLILGYAFIRQRAMTAHTICMLAACGTSTLFLVTYLTYHYFHGSTRFPGHGLAKMIYFTILISHTILAIVIVPMVIVTLYRAFRLQFNKHSVIARYTLPIWLYVSVTGVIVYWMLYQVKWS